MPICSDAISAAVERNCNNNVGGLKHIYIADYENFTEYTDTEDDGVIDSITMASSSQFFDFYFAKNSAMYEENLVQNLEIGSTYFEQKVAFSVPYRDETRRESIRELVSGQKKLMVLLQDNNNIWWLYFVEEGGIVTTLTGGSAASKGELNGYALEITADSVTQARVVDPTIIDDLLQPAA